MFIPDEDGNPYLVDLVPSKNSSLRQEVLYDHVDEKVSFWLYNK